jgi:hypothetical protein
MKMSTHFGFDELRLLNHAEEIEIETEIVQEAQNRRVIWVVVVGSHAYVRSVNGKQGHWYQELIEKSAGAIHASGRRIPVRAVPVSEVEILMQVSEAYVRKYGHYPDDVAWLIGPEVLPTTLRLEPISQPARLKVMQP